MNKSEPITFLFTQDEMEKIMNQINNLTNYSYNNQEEWVKIRKDIQHKINQHKERGEWE